jgi:probable HAF family extracellular repeat protein
MRDLGTLGGTRSHARAINRRGQVVGDADEPGDRALHAFLYERGRMADLGTLGGTTSHARGINDMGQVVGDADTAGNAAHHAFVSVEGGMKDIGSLGGRNSFASAINNRGQVVGYSETTPVALHRTLTRAGGMRHASLGSREGAMLSSPESSVSGGSRATIGHAGDAVQFDHHAFLYDEDGRMLDLSSLPEVRQAGWTSLNYAVGINDKGQIVGSGTIGGVAHAFLLSPVGAPGSRP